MTRLASRFGAANSIRRDRPLTIEELFRTVPSVFSEEKHESRSDRYTYIPTITLLDSLQKEGFYPFFACQTRVRDDSRRDHTKHLLRLRRHDQIRGAKCLKSSYLIAMMDRVAIKCYRAFFAMFVKMGWFVAIPLERSEFHTKVMSSIK